MERIVKECQTKLDWLNKLVQKQGQEPKFKEPVFTVAQVVTERNTLEKSVMSVLSRPKPAPPKEDKKEPATTPPAETAADGTAPMETDSNAEQPTGDKAPAAEAAPAGETMEVD
jgi:heat shock protein 4